MDALKAEGWVHFHPDMVNLEVGDEVRFAFLDGYLTGRILSERQHGWDWHFHIQDGSGDMHYDVAMDRRITHYRKVD